MKNICIIAGTFDQYQILSPLMKEIQKDEALYLTVISKGRHLSSEMEITYARIEEEGYIIDEKTDIAFRGKFGQPSENPPATAQWEYEFLLRRICPDIVVVFGNSRETLSAAIAATLNAIPVAHIRGGESDFGAWDDSYGVGITKLSHLHFTETMTYRRQVIRLGEHSGRVFNVGSLLLEKIRTAPEKGKIQFFTDMGFDKDDRFIVVSYQPDASLGSKNAHLFQEVLDSLNDVALAGYKLVLNKPDTEGLGKMINQMMDAFVRSHPDRARALPFMDLADFSRAVRYCCVLIDNTSKGRTIASCCKTPVINIGDRQKGRIKTQNIIDCHPQKKEAILCAIQNGLSADFRWKIKDLLSPFEQASTALKIKDTLKAFSRKDICKKEFYNC